jgi:hypothetical protein
MPLPVTFCLLSSTSLTLFLPSILPFLSLMGARQTPHRRRRLSSRDVETSKPVAMRKNASTPATPGWLPPLAVAPTHPAVHVQHYNAWDTTVFVLLLSLLAIPACYGMAYLQEILAPYTLYCALAILAVVIGLYNLVVFKQLPHDRPHAFFLSWFSVAAFASVVTILMALTIDGSLSVMNW